MSTTTSGSNAANNRFLFSHWLFVRLLACSYSIAFFSAYREISGLIGNHGILPAAQYLEEARKAFGNSAAFYVPTLLWQLNSDRVLEGVCLIGCVLSLLLFCGILEFWLLFILWLLYRSIVTVGQDFFSFQWDALLLEAGFLTLGISSLRICHRLGTARVPGSLEHAMVLWLTFRLYFSSGMVKLASGDSTWMDLTALAYHFETQPLPNPVAYFVHQLPLGVHRVITAITLFIEIVIPFALFFPRRFRHVASALLIFLQVLISLTGNYTFFNLLTVALCLIAIDDKQWRSLMPWLALPEGSPAKIRSLWRSLFAVTLLIVSSAQFLRSFRIDLLPHSIARIVTAWGITSNYGLFSVMTTTRPEIIIEGSDDLIHWQEYEFRYKVGDLGRPPPIIAPLQPRLDWQMWFAALSGLRETAWFLPFSIRLLENSSSVTALLRNSLFPDRPPKYIRALLYEYHFTSIEEYRRTKKWWKRDYLHVYLPPISLK